MKQRLRRKNQLYISRKKSSLRAYSVSYTHLDVYKRQPAQRRNVCLVSEASRKRATGPAHNPPDSPPCTRAQRTSRHPQRETHFLSKRRQIHSGMESTSSPSRRCAPAKLRPTRLCNAQPSAAPTLGASSNTAARKLPINCLLYTSETAL